MLKTVWLTLVVVLSMAWFAPGAFADKAPAYSEGLNSVTQQFDLNSITNPNIKVTGWIDQGVNYVINRIVSVVAQTIGAIAVLAFSIGGFLMLMSGGNEQLVEKGKAMMRYSLLGLVFVLTAYLLVVLIQTLVVSIFNKY